MQVRGDYIPKISKISRFRAPYPHPYVDQRKIYDDSETARLLTEKDNKKTRLHVTHM